MAFHQKLNLLMDQFHISNSKLSKELNVDASLVSRWRNGQRIPSTRSAHLPIIASYFLTQHGYSYQQEFIRKILDDHKLVVPHIDDPTELLSDWFINEKATSVVESTTKATQQAAATFIEKFKDMMNMPKSGSLPPQVPMPVISLGKTERNYYVFKENDGRRRAILYLLQTISDLPLPTDIYLISEEDMSWLSEDRSFQVQWGTYLRNIILQGHRIHIIHMVNRDSNELLQALSLWIPLHLMGSIQSYYYPKYSAPLVKHTWFIVKDVCMITSSSVTQQQAENICYLSHDLESVQAYQSMFIGRIQDCKPLVEVFRIDQHLLLLSKLASSTSYISPTTSLHFHINSLFLPDSVFSRYSKTLVSDQRKEYIDLIRKWRTRIFQSLSLAPYTDIFPSSTLKELASYTYKHYDPTFFGLTPIEITDDEANETLKNIQHVLKEYEMFNVYLINQTSKETEISVNITLKENTDSFFTTTVSPGIPFLGLYVHEGNILHSLSYYLDDIIVQIPSLRRNKQETMKEIEKIMK